MKTKPTFNKLLVKRYTKIFDNKERKYNKFISSLLLYNNTGDLVTLPSFQQNVDNSGLWTIFKTDAQAKHYATLGYTGIFLTLTLDSLYHFGHDLNVEEQLFFYENDCYDEDEILNRDAVVTLGYKTLKTAFKRIYNKFSNGRNNYITIPYSCVIEPHKKDFTPHLHAICFVPTELLYKFLEHINTTIKMFQKKSVLGKQFDIQIINDIRKTGGYITKYTQKSLQTKFVIGWARKHKIRLFTTSRDIIPRYIFKIISGRLGVSKEDLSDFSYIQAHLNVCHITVNYVNGNVKTFGNPFGSYSLSIFKLNNEAEDDEDEFDIKDLNDFYYCIQPTIKLFNWFLYKNNKIIANKPCYSFQKMV